ncbi:hypothetical protein [Limnoglobus roseus]|uniref:Uncharacterized protein n=1 Tax=Limnoglobus roseus TaxID=2598579 RepID=A0A5C1AFA8_9BACT|nr:hypothetical protein [Limnoglobus roseus]QEL16656.1 hypothetical protein PX52LOC_03617 [Limnoglobus roseus]
MTFQEAVVELLNKHAKAELSPSAQRGSAFNRAKTVRFKKGKGGVYEGKDADGTEVLVYFNDQAGVISCTEIEADAPDDDE